MINGKMDDLSAISVDNKGLVNQLNYLEALIPPSVRKDYDKLKSKIVLLIDENEKQKKHIQRLLKIQKQALSKIEELFRS